MDDFQATELKPSAKDEGSARFQAVQGCGVRKVARMVVLERETISAGELENCPKCRCVFHVLSAAAGYFAEMYQCLTSYAYPAPNGTSS